MNYDTNDRFRFRVWKFRVINWDSFEKANLERNFSSPGAAFKHAPTLQ
jgi:hypothetical protein